jgi:HAD superfamily hydrolase (TIGR01509 family)
MVTANLIIFDCDGVLVDSEVIACRLTSELLGEFGINLSAREIVERYTGISANVMSDDIADRFGVRLPSDFAITLRNRVVAAFENELKPMKGAELALRSIGQSVCVASSSDQERIRCSLKVTGLLSYFDNHIFSAAQVAKGKPAPDLFLFAAASMSTAPGQSVVVEDSVSGVRAAGAAGMHALGFTGGSHCSPDHAHKLMEAGALVTFDNLLELSPLLTLLPRSDHTAQ